MRKKSICLIVAALILLSVCGCSKKTETNTKALRADTSSEKHDKSTITLLFNKSDTFNPYTAKTENNRLISKLIFEPLVKTDNDIKPVFRLAQDVKLEGTTCTVTIKNALFSDGTPVTASDVIYSYGLAKNYGGLYSSHLYEVASINAVSDRAVVFSLTMYDSYFANLLDFPILKSGSDKITDSDGNLEIPIGCGRYMPTADTTKLIRNDKFFGKKSNIKTVKLINAPDDDSVSHYIEVGAADLYFSDLSSGNLVRMSGKRTDVNLNNLIYIGLNTKSDAFKNKYLRYAVSAAIDRTAICRDAFFNSASVATGYFNPSLKKASAVQSLKPTSDLQITVDNLKKMGYNDKNADGYYVNSNGTRHILKMLVNKNNNSMLAAANLIAEQLKSAGIQLTVVECSYNQFIKQISSNAFEMYLGEISVLPNFDMTQLCLPGGSVAYGISEEKKKDEVSKSSDEQAGDEEKETDKTLTEEESIKGIYEAYRNNTASISDVAGTLLTEMPQIPLLYRHGLLFSNENLSGISVSESDVFFSIEDYKID